MDAAKIRIAVDADASNVGATMAAVGRSVTGMEQQVTGAFTRMRASFAALPAGTKALTGFGIGAALAGTALAATIGPAIQFESAFAGVQKTVSGTPAQLAEIRSELLAMSTVMPTSAADLAGIAENAGQLGVAAGDVTEFTKVIAQLGETTDLDFNSASQSLARFLNIVDGGVGNIGEAADVLVELGNNSATTESQILTFSTRLAAAFSAAGASQDQIQGIAAAFSSLGVEAESGGSSLSRIITDIVDSAKLGTEELGVFARVAGVTSEEFAALALSQGGAVKALQLFTEGLGETIEAGESITPILESLGLQGIRTSRVLTLGALGADLLAESLAMAARAAAEGGAAQEEYDKRLATTAARLSVLGNQLQVLAIQAGTPFLEGIAEGADLAAAAIKELGAIVAPLGAALLDAGANAVTLAGALLDLFGPVFQGAAAVLVGLVAGVTGLVEAFNALGTVGTALASVLAVLALFGPSFTAARVAVAAFALNMALIGPGAASAAAGVQLLQAALSAGPLIIATAAVAALGKAWIDAGRAAEESAAAFEQGIDAAKSAGDLAALRSEWAQLGDRIDELSTTDWSFWEKGREAAKGLLEILTPMSNSVLDAATEIEHLNSVMSEQETAKFNVSLEVASEKLGITEQAVFGLAQEMGLLGPLTASSNQAMTDSIAAMDAYLATVGPTTAQNKEFLDSFKEGPPSMAEYNDHLGLTGAQLQFVADSIDGVELEDLFSEEYGVRAAAYAAIVGKTSGELDTLAAMAGVATGAFIDYQIQLLALVGAHDSLRAAIDGTRTALDAQFEQQRIAADATTAYSTALDGLSAETLPSVVTAMRDATLEQLGLATSMGEANAIIAANEQALRDAAVAYGIDIELVDALIASLGNIPPKSVAEIIHNAIERKAEVDALNVSLDEVVGDYVADLLTTGGPEAQEEIRRVLALALAVDGNFTATIGVSGADSAIAALNSVAAAARGIPSYASTTIATRYVSSYVSVGGGGTSAPRSAPRSSGGNFSGLGGVFVEEGGIVAFGPGGFLDVAGSARLEQPNQARLYPPTGTGRLFAEPPTGGEAYIPLGATKRPQSISIWEETGRRLGVLPSTPAGLSSGGGQTINASMPITVNASPGMNESALARAVGQQVNAALRDTARELANTRG